MRKQDSFGGALNTSVAMSVIVPSLNQGVFIEETLNSILCQTVPDVEVIVVDGGSKDGTIEILRGFGPAIQWTSRPDRGIHEALNHGFSLAQGEIVGWLNSDDVYFRRDVLSRVLTEFAEQSELDVVYGDVAIIGADSSLLRLRLLPGFDQDRLERSNIIAQPAAFLRRPVIEQERPRALLSLDYEYWIRLGRKGYIFKHVPSVLAAERQYSNRVSMRFRAQMETEFRTYKAEMGISAQTRLASRILDRLELALLRLKGFLLLIWMLSARGFDDELAFPMRIRSRSKLLWNQLSHGIFELGLDVEWPEARPDRSSQCK